MSRAVTQPVVLGTRNAGKLRELVPLFEAAGIVVVDLRAIGLGEEREDEGAVEQYETFEANALAKARYFHVLTGGRPCVADDSGLEVAALGGEPGVRSRRWAADGGEASDDVDAANNRRLLRELEGAADRRARFVCAAAYVDGERELVCRGTTTGRIVDPPRGREGFGYDPYFLDDRLGRTLAEATVAEKQAVSHRGAAFAALIAALGASD